MKEKNENKEEYSIDFLARFACLYEGVNLACQRAETNRVRFRKK